MKIQEFLVCLLLGVTLCLAIETCKENEECIPNEQCPSFVKKFRSREQLPLPCGFNGTDPNVCCTIKPLTKAQTTTIYNKERKSIQKCREYSTDGCRKGMPLIVRGSPAKPREFPHMALIGFYKNNRLNNSILYLCGGSLISPNYVLTAGHCLKHYKHGPVRFARLGDLARNNTLDDDFVQERAISKTFIHPNYYRLYRGGVVNDIALLRLNESVVFTSHVRPLCLNVERHVRQHGGIATGWGRNDYLGEFTDLLMKVKLNIYASDECENHSLKINDDIQICAGGSKINNTNNSNDTRIGDTCQGDSGGPLQVYHPEYQCMYSIVGITSYGIACGLIPAVYTRVSHYIDWIENIVW